MLGLWSWDEDRRTHEEIKRTKRLRTWGIMSRDTTVRELVYRGCIGEVHHGCGGRPCRGGRDGN